MVTVENRRRFLKKAVGYGISIVAGYEFYKYASTTEQSTEFGPLVDDLHLSRSELSTYLNIKPYRPELSKMFEAWGGWAGPGIYIFERMDFKTPYIDKEQQLNDWNYVLYGRPRMNQLDHKIGHISPVIKMAVDTRNREFLKLHKHMILRW
jgi:hypothetical protein